MTDPQPWPGAAYPLGASYDGAGTNFALFSEVADKVELCLFDGGGAGATETRIRLSEVDRFIWHGYLPGIGPGQHYGYRVHGQYDPAHGQRCNPAKLLLDPYTKAVSTAADQTSGAHDLAKWDESLFGYRFTDPERRNDTDSATHAPKSVVVSPFFDWADDRHPRTPYHETVIYEAHVRGLTIAHPEIPPGMRGTYTGLAHPVMINYFAKLGITAVELMPAHQFITDRHLAEQGLSNYWGYNTIAFLAPHNGYAAAGTVPGRAHEVVSQFKAMVRELHAANIEVILDVVYNHTAEGNHLGPTLSMRGVDNPAYYRLVEGDPRYYMDYTGTGNSLNVRNPHTLQLIMDSLRYWVIDMHVDGFRFDLASTLAREFYDVDRLATFFELVQQDPVISQVKLIAEPWDVGPGGYQVGNFPPLWTEWNGKYRDTVRDFWRGQPGTLGEFGFRLTGSSDLYQHDGRRPYASINFVTAHDGFTLTDLVSYNDKHNEANGEGGRDGTDDNRSWNCGIEGPTDDPDVLALRARQRRNMLATLLLSQGTPMLLHGDELGRTQRGNNNAYCQDNELSWVNWDRAEKELIAFTAALIAMRREHPVFRRRRFFAGRPIRGGDELRDIAWFTEFGEEMTEQDWEVEVYQYLTVFLNGEGIPDTGARGQRVTDNSFLLCFNAHHEDIIVQLPGNGYGQEWTVVLDTATGEPPGTRGLTAPGGAKINITARSMVVLERTA
jgi:isoamylase